MEVFSCIKIIKLALAMLLSSTTISMAMDTPNGMDMCMGQPVPFEISKEELKVMAVETANICTNTACHFRVAPRSLSCVGYTCCFTGLRAAVSSYQIHKRFQRAYYVRDLAEVVVVKDDTLRKRY